MCFCYQNFGPVDTGRGTLFTARMVRLSFFSGLSLQVVFSCANPVTAPQAQELLFGDVRQASFTPNFDAYPTEPVAKAMMERGAVAAWHVGRAGSRNGGDG